MDCVGLASRSASLRTCTPAHATRTCGHTRICPHANHRTLEKETFVFEQRIRMSWHLKRQWWCPTSPATNAAAAACRRCPSGRRASSACTVRFAYTTACGVSSRLRRSSIFIHELCACMRAHAGGYAYAFGVNVNRHANDPQKSKHSGEYLVDPQTGCEVLTLGDACLLHVRR